MRRLHQGKTRAREGAVLVEGVRAVTEAVHSGADVLFSVCSAGVDPTATGRGLREQLRGLADCEEVPHADFRELAATEQSQGVLAVCREPVAAVTDALGGDVLVVDALQDPGNVGTLVRSAVAFGFRGVVCLDGTTDPWGPKAVRASAGTVFRLPVARCELSVALRELAEGHRIVAAAADGRPLSEVVVEWARDSRPVAVTVGNEGAGVRAEMRSAAHDVVSIEMSGPVESLNAGIAGSIVMHRINEARQ